jgi:hypothetical protein
MERTTQNWLRAVTTVLLAAASHHGQADFESGLSAYRTQAYGEAFDDWQRCANENVAACQYAVGVLHDEG